MKIYCEVTGNQSMRAKQETTGYITLPDCEECGRYAWTEEEIRTIEWAAKVTCLVTINARVASGLVDPVRPLWKYDNREIGRLRGLLQIGAFSGVRGMLFKYISAANSKIITFVVHIQDHKKYRDWIPRDTVGFYGLFRATFPEHFTTDRLMDHLRFARSRTIEQIDAYLTRVFDEAEAQS